MNKKEVDSVPEVVETKDVAEVTEQHIKEAYAPTDPNALIQLAISQGANVEALERVFALQERWQANQAKSAFTQAMANLKAEMPIVKKLVQGQNSKYAPIEDIAQQCDPFISKHGFSYRWDTKLKEAEMTVICTATHIAGHSETSSFTSPVLDQITSKAGNTVTNKVQASAGTITYLKRYTLCNLFGIMVAGEDQDARIKNMAPKLPASPRSKIMTLLKSLNVDTTDGIVIKEQVKKMTGEELVEANFDEIISKLTVLWQEQQENAN